MTGTEPAGVMGFKIQKRTFDRVEGSLGMAPSITEQTGMFAKYVLGPWYIAEYGLSPCKRILCVHAVRVTVVEKALE